MDVRMPDGTIIRNVPAGTTKADLLAKYSAMGATPAAEGPGGFVRGLMDPISGASELLAEITPEPIERGINWLNNRLVDLGVPLARIPQGGQRQLLRQQEAAYQQARAAGGETGIDWDRLGGNVLSPANLMAAAGGMRVAGAVAPRLGLGAKGTGYLGATGAGVGSAALMPTTGDDPYWQEKALQTGIGAGAGMLGQVGGNLLARIVKPQQSDEVSALMAQGITPTPGQAMGGAVGRTEEKLMSLPILGDAIEAGRQRAVNQLNRAAFQRVVGPVGVKVPRDIEPGPNTISWLEDTLKAAYDDVVPNLKGGWDKPFSDQLGDLVTGINRLEAKNINRFYKILEEDVLNQATNAGRFSGESWKKMESALGQEWRRYAKSLDPDEQALSNALRQLQANLRSLAARQNPKYAKKLRSINRGWAEYDLVARAAATKGASARGGQMTPANLTTAAKAKDYTVGKRGFAKDQSLGMAELYGPAERVLGSRVPDSGTAGRLLTNALAIGGATGLGAPGALLPAVAASVPYLPGMQRLVTGALMRRPGVAEPAAELLRQSAPYMVPGINPLLQGMLGPAQGR